MQENTKKKRGAVASAILVLLLLLGYLGAIFYVSMFVGFDLFPIIVLVVYGVAVMLAIFCIIYAMRQRLKELDSGEEEEAKKY